MTEEYVSDYEPLSIEEIVEILKQARIELHKSTNGHEVARLQVRLSKGFIGSTMPNDDESNAYKAQIEMDHLFMVFTESELIDAHAMAMVFYMLMQTK